MGYNVVDIINKAVDIAIRRKTVYENVGKEKCDIVSIRILSMVLMKEVDRTIEQYEALLKEINDIDFEEIDFLTYDKISSLINNFNEGSIDIEDINNVRVYIKLSLDIEKSLLMDIQDGFVKIKSDIHTKILSDIIDNNARI